MPTLRRFDDPVAKALAVLAAASAVALVAALFLQYVLGMPPCHLCVWQRWPYLGVVVAGVLGLWWQRPWPALVVAALLLTVETGLAAYHVAVEQGVLALPESCAAVGQAATIEDLRAQLDAAPPRCDQVPFTVAGLSLAGWNGVLAVLLLAFSLAALLRGRSATEQHREGSVT